MSQPFDRVYNFSAGPGTLPLDVLQEVQLEMLNYEGTGMSVMEMSHRSSAFEKIMSDAQEDLRSLMSIPDDYEVLFLQGGASLQFSMVPMNFLGNGTGQYVVTGAWGQKAVEAARQYGNIDVIWDGKQDGFKSAPSQVDANDLATYIHVTTNETIQGVQFSADLDVRAPLVCDMSSDILSRPIDVSRYSLIYAGAQKNMGPAGVTVVIVKRDFLEKIQGDLAPTLDYRVAVKNDSMYNTPPCWSIYVCGKVYHKILRKGGLAKVFENNNQKAAILYTAIDSSNGFFNGHASRDSRSLMNVTFTLPTEDLTTKFIDEAAEAGMKELKGHRSVGGCRASIYNAFPIEGCQALADFMVRFASENS